MSHPRDAADSIAALNTLKIDLGRFVSDATPKMTDEPYPIFRPARDKIRAPGSNGP